jgi:serine/threonine protein kinase
VDHPTEQSSDIWALGIIIYVLTTNEYPFDITNEEAAMNNIKNANISYRKLEQFPRLQKLLKNMLVLDPKKRWKANQVLEYLQQDFCVVVQRFWRGALARLAFRKQCAALVKIQSKFVGLIGKIGLVKGWLIRTRYIHKREEVMQKGAVTIQRKWRNYSTSRFYRKIRRMIMNLQSNVLTRQIRRAYLKLRYDTITLQSFIRRFLAYGSFKTIKFERADLIRDIGGLNTRIDGVNKNTKGNLYFSTEGPNSMGKIKTNFGQRNGQSGMQDQERDQGPGSTYFFHFFHFF